MMNYFFIVIPRPLLLFIPNRYQDSENQKMLHKIKKIIKNMSQESLFFILYVKDSKKILDFCSVSNITGIVYK